MKEKFNVRHELPIPGIRELEKNELALTNLNSDIVPT